MRQIVTAKVAHGGRILIPAEIRRQLEMEIGENVNLEVENGSLRITSSRAALRRLQRRFKKLVPDGVSLVDELIAERRSDAANE